jgi:two-component sensor histidine kinase
MTKEEPLILNYADNGIGLPNCFDKFDTLGMQLLNYVNGSN